MLNSFSLGLRKKYLADRLWLLESSFPFAQDECVYCSVVFFSYRIHSFFFFVFLKSYQGVVGFCHHPWLVTDCNLKVRFFFRRFKIKIGDILHAYFDIREVKFVLLYWLLYWVLRLSLSVRIPFYFFGLYLGKHHFIFLVLLLVLHWKFLAQLTTAFNHRLNHAKLSWYRYYVFRHSCSLKLSPNKFRLLKPDKFSC